MLIAARRVPASVVGDGQATVQQLVERHVPTAEDVSHSKRSAALGSWKPAPQSEKLLLWLVKQECSNFLYRSLVASFFA